MCLSSEGKELHIVWAAKNVRCPNIFVHSLGIHRIILSEERKFILGVKTESRSDKLIGG